MTAIVVDELRKQYGTVAAVDGVSFRVEQGEVYGLLGHNGAGKSTTVEILEGHRTASSGAVSVLGLDPSSAGREMRDRIGIVLQASSVETQLTVREALRFYGSCYRRPRSIDDVVEMVGLTEKADERIGTLSGGQRRRLDLGLGIIGSPELLFLDEPTTGFDPVARRQSWELVQRLCDGGTTVLLTTHYLDEAEHLADRVGVLANGRMVAEGTPEQLMATAPDATVAFDLPPGLAASDLAVPAGAEVTDTSVRIDTEAPTAALAPIIAAATERGVELVNLTVRRPSLEDVFLRIGESDGSDS
ncbi:MAG: ABC transporter ATP-binding protein [Ilumatobacteraceae bacterium]|nr:ABC transporter ATP-binding protein [Ilumatobacteraceae bacterium]